MIRIDFLKPLKYLYCDNCLNEECELIRIKVFRKEEMNNESITLCKVCFNELKKVLVGKESERND